MSRDMVAVFSAGSAEAVAYLPLPCRHEHIVPVTLELTGEHVATLCLDCDGQLPAEWNPSWPIHRPPRPEPERR